MATAPAAGTKERYLSEHQRFAGRPDEPAWLRELRSRGVQHFAAHGFPVARRGNEAWKYTNVSSIAETPFTPPEDRPRVSSADIAPFLLSRSWPRLTFVNGRFRPELSSAREEHGGVALTSLSPSTAEAVRLGLGRLVPPEADGFTALNAAFLEQLAFIDAPPGLALDKPVHLLFLSAPTKLPAMICPRVMVHAGRGSSLTLVESYAALGDHRYFTNTVAEISLDEGAVIDHYRLLLEGAFGYHIGTSHVHQAADSSLTSSSLAAGGGLARNSLSVTLDGEGAACTLNGLYVASGTQHVDHHLFIDHAKPRTTSHEFFKGIVGGKSRAVFGGRVLVRKGSQKVEAHQYDRNLLLSQGAEVDSRPQLEIFADDVKCTHGATAGQLSENDLFYLQARGIDLDQARDILAHAFASELLDRIRLAPIRKQMEALLLKRGLGTRPQSSPRS